MKNIKQQSNLDTLASNLNITLIERLVQKNIKGGVTPCPPPTTDDF